MQLTGFQKVTYICEKCGRQVIVETDYLSPAALKSLHKCKKGKAENELLYRKNRL